jgi:hypothetical protein
MVMLHCIFYYKGVRSCGLVLSKGVLAADLAGDAAAVFAAAAAVVGYKSAIALLSLPLRQAVHGTACKMPCPLLFLFVLIRVAPCFWQWYRKRIMPCALFGFFCLKHFFVCAF